MKFLVPKVGWSQFDALHALGLGVVLATAVNLPVTVEDCSSGYLLYIKCKSLPKIGHELFEKLFSLPAAETYAQENREFLKELPWHNLDGLLAAVFTTPGVRALSVNDLMKKQAFAQNKSGDTYGVIQAGIEKANRYIQGLEKRLTRLGLSKNDEDWIKDITQYYEVNAPYSPEISWEFGSKTDISLLMPIEPAASFSTRDPISNGQISDGKNIMISGARFSTFLAVVGATRFLRGHRLAGKRAIFYVPLPRKVTLLAQDSFPIWKAMDSSLELTLLSTIFRFIKNSNESWSGISYQVLQTQGAQQSISIDLGWVDINWWEKLLRNYPDLIRFWRGMIWSEHPPLELDSLAGALIHRRPGDWVDHLLELAWKNWGPSAGKSIREYSIDEVIEVTNMVTTEQKFLLSSILLSKKGTVQFGRAIRQLKEVGGFSVREVLDDLKTVQSVEMLLLMLSPVIEACTVAKAKSNFVIVPDEKDLQLLIVDVERHGPRKIAAILVIMSGVRYSPKDEKK